MLKKAIVLILFILLISSCTPADSDDGIIETAEKQNAEDIKGMSFEVEVPKNTQEGDTIWIYIRQKGYRMEQADNYTYSLFLSQEELFGEDYYPDQNKNINYRYSRNGYDFRTAEYLRPTTEEPDRDTENYFWTEQGRETVYEPGKIQKDKIARWRWFPDSGMPNRTTDIEPEGEFMQRINNIEFRSGQVIEDLYTDAFYDFIDSTAEHIKETGYMWSEIDPPWQWTEVKGMPKVVNDVDNNPNYPDDETFLEEVMAYKERGIKVLISPQLCCTSLGTEARPKEWWEQYFDETERFLLHFARLAEKANADAFMYSIGSWEIQDAEIDINERWNEIWSNIREEFSGELGQMVWMLGPDTSSDPQPIPDAEFVKWADKLDFFYVSTEYPLSEKDNPTDAELLDGARKVLDGAKAFYDEFNKPIIIRNGYFNVKHSWKGQTFYSISSIPWLSDPEAALRESKYEFNTVDQARTINAYFKAISERPWIIGYFHFGYTHWEDPLSPWMSIRGKPSEDLWRKWNNKIYEET